MQMNLSDAQIQAYQRDGVIRIEQAVNRSWIDRLNAVVESQLNNPSKWANDANPDARTNRMFTDRYQWQKNEEIRAYIFESGVAGIAAQAMQSEKARFYFDHLLVKEPNTPVDTPWHQDVPYWPFLGQQICSVWLALNDVSIDESAMEFVRGSHRARKYYLPELFGAREDHPNAWISSGEGERVPPISAKRDDYDIIGWNMQAGDVVVFSAWILHGAGGNQSPTKRRAAISTRWLGDDVTWHPHAGADPTVTQANVSLKPGDLIDGEAILPEVYPA